MASRATLSFICTRCVGALLQPAPARDPRLVPRATRCRPYSSWTDPAHLRAAKKTDGSARSSSNATPNSEPGPMARRLEEATEEALLSGGRAGRRAVEEAGFSEELKERLLAKVEDAKFRYENASAFAEANLSTAAGQGTRLTAASQPWSGEEPTEDAVLRMLDDARKSLPPGLRGKPKLPDLKPVDMRISQGSVPTSRRAESARDKAMAYTNMGMKEHQNGLSDEEKETMRKEFKERYRPGARAVPNTLSGLASLADERIEVAIARGQFKHIQRGKGVERDTRADNPFIDTTEYIMNKLIKRQEIVPPWIEKQQELVKAAHVFRSRLRNDWKRYAARMIASKGGSLQDQMKRARMYARSEKVHNPRRRKVEQISITTNSTEDPVMVKVREQLDELTKSELVPESETENTIAAGEIDTTQHDATLSAPFRSPDWIEVERSYMELAISNLNALTRSYNLMAPDLAKKAYFNLERELNTCYAEVAPELADAIKDRASQPKIRVETTGHRPGSILDRFSHEGYTSKVYDSKAPHYGFKQMWRDLFNRSAN